MRGKESLSHSISALSRGDAHGLLALWNLSMVYDPLNLGLLEEKIWGDADYADELCLACSSGDEVVGMGTAVVRTTDTGITGYIKMLCVHPQHRRQGIATELVQRLESSLSQLGCKKVRAFESTPNYLVPGIDVRYTPLLVFLRRRGYEQFGETFNLTADLRKVDLDTSADEAELATDNITIARASKADQTSVMEFLDRVWPAWKAEIAVSLRNSPCTLHVAKKDHIVVAFSAYDTNNLNTGWFGPMGTDPAYRGKGIGAVLLKRCLVDVREQGHQTAIIPWVGPVAFYLHYVDAHIARTFHRLEKELDS